jgi:hypothetical protein
MVFATSTPGELAVRLEGGGTCVARLRAEAERLIRGEHEREAKARAFSPPSCRSSSMLTGLKSRLPSQRVRLPGLRPSVDDVISHDPETMASLASAYWSKVWGGIRIHTPRGTT